MPVKTTRTRLSTRILLWSFVPTTIILLAVAITIFYAYQRVTEDLVVGRNQQLTRLSAGQLSSDLGEYVSTLEMLTRSSFLYSSNPVLQTAALRQSANTLLIFDGGVLVLNPDGEVTVTEPEIPGLVGQNWSDSQFFRQIIHSASASGEPAFSNILSLGVEDQDVVAVAVPILNERRVFRGALVGMFRLGATSYSAFYGGIVKLRLGETGSIFLVDASGRVIFHPDEARIGSDLHFQPDVEQVMKREAGFLRTSEPSGQEILATFAPVPGTPWGLVNEENWNDLLASSRGYGQFLIILMGLGIAIPVLVVWMGVRRITGPVAKLIDGAREITGGKYGQQITMRTGDELEDLITQFNHMSLQLRESYTQLEKRVAARTQDLATLNATAAVASRSLHLDRIMQDALDETLRALDMEMGAAFDLDTEGQYLRLIAHRNLPDDFPYHSAVRPFSGSALAQAVSAGQPLIWPAAEFPDAVIRPWLDRSGVAHVITVPLVAKSKLVGVFNLGTGKIRDFSPEECALMAAIGQQIGVAVDNAHLYQKAEETATLAERTRLARELHDSVMQSLYSVTLFAEAAASQLAAGNTATAKEHLEELRDTAQEALREMRLLIFELRPLALEQNGLSTALQERLEAVEVRGGIKSDLHVEGEEHLPASTQKELYHVAQEVLNNVLKHARAQRVQVSLRYAPDSVCLEIIDDGVGFDPSQVRPGGMGLEGMHARVRQLGGHLALESVPGRGTRVTVQAPLEEEGTRQGALGRKIESDGSDDSGIDL